MASLGAMKTGVVVVGAGGHAKVCIELLRTMGEDVVYCVGGADSPEECLNVPVLKGDENLSVLRRKGYSRLFVAIGSNAARERMASFASELGYQLVNAISRHAVISPSAVLGRGIAIMAGAVLNAEVFVEDLSIINTGASIDHDCRIGRAVHIAPQCALAGNVSVGAFSFLGVGSIVIPEVCVGENVMVGAGSVLIKNIESKSLVFGVPAKYKKS